MQRTVRARSAQRSLFTHAHAHPRSRPPAVVLVAQRKFASVFSRAATAALPPRWFSGSLPIAGADGGSDGGPVDERTLNMGKTIRVLQERMPTLLQSPLPTEILSPHISLHLFPSTHPHLPTVRGRVAYIAALWTAPVAWGRIPGGNTRLEVLSERMLKPGPPGSEQLIVRWRTTTPPKNRTKNKPEGGVGAGGARGGAGGAGGGGGGGGEGIGAKEIKTGTTAVADGEFSGIFVFEFDEKGRVATHTIENSDEERADRTSPVITVTEWLLRKARGGNDAEGLTPACVRNDETR